MTFWFLAPLTACIINIALCVYISLISKRNTAGRAYCLFALLIAFWEATEAISWTPVVPDHLAIKLLRYESLFWTPTGFVFLNFIYRLTKRPKDLPYRIFLIFTLIFTPMGAFTNLVTLSCTRTQWGISPIIGSLYFMDITLTMIMPGLYSVFLVVKAKSNTDDFFSRRQYSLLIWGLLVTIVACVVSGPVLFFIVNMDSIPYLPSTLITIESIFIFIAIVRYNFLSIDIKDYVHNILSLIHDSVIVLDRNQHIINSNQPAKSLFSYSSGPLQNMKISDLGLEGYSYEENYQDKEITLNSGNNKCVVLLSQSLLMQSGIMSGKLLIFKDITDRKQVEDKLRDGQKKYRLLIDNYNSPITVVDKDGFILLMNIAGAKNFGKTPKDIAGASLFDMIPDSVDELKDTFRMVIETGNGTEIETVIDLPSGKRWFMSDLQPVEDSHGNIYAIQSITYDITENKLAKEEIVKLNETLEGLLKDRTKQLKDARQEIVQKEHKSELADMTTGTLHNVKNILNSVKVSSEAVGQILSGNGLKGLKNANNMLEENIENIEDYICNNPKGKKLMQYYLKLDEIFESEAQTSRDHMKRLSEKIDAIVDIISAQQEYGGGSSLTEEIEVENIIQDALTMQTGSLKSYGIQLIKTFNDVPKIYAQKTKLFHILINLIKNAKEAMEETPVDKRTLTILTEHKDTEVFISLKDKGHGISPEHLKKMFTHGFTTKVDGHGFGLHSCASYMKEMGGEIWAESKGEEKGATFNIKFPVLQSADSSSD